MTGECAAGECVAVDGRAEDGEAMENVPAVSHLGIVREPQRLGSIVLAGMLQ